MDKVDFKKTLNSYRATAGIFRIVDVPEMRYLMVDGHGDPQLRQRSLYPDWVLERRKRAERALTSVVATCYLLGVSTRRMDKLVQTLGITGLSKSQVSTMAKELDEHVERPVA